MYIQVVYNMCIPLATTGPVKDVGRLLILPLYFILSWEGLSTFCLLVISNARIETRSSSDCRLFLEMAWQCETNDFVFPETLAKSMLIKCRNFCLNKKKIEFIVLNKKKKISTKLGFECGLRSRRVCAQFIPRYKSTREPVRWLVSSYNDGSRWDVKKRKKYKYIYREKCVRSIAKLSILSRNFSLLYNTRLEKYRVLLR